MDTENVASDLQIFVNVAQQLQLWWGPITRLAIVIGLFLCISGLIFFIKNKNMGGQHLGKAIGTTIAGLLLINFIGFVDLFSYSLFETDFGKASDDFKAYTDMESNSPDIIYLNFALGIITIVGLIAFIKGVWLIKEASNNPQISYGTAITHIVGGTIAVNIKTFINLLASTLGGSAGEAINNIMGNVGNI